MTVAEILRGALALIRDPKCWTQGWYARDGRGRQLFYQPGMFEGTGHPGYLAALERPGKMVPSKPVCFCLLGAIIHASIACSSRDRLAAQAHMSKAVAPPGVVAPPGLVAFNDSASHADVVAHLERAIDTAP